MDVRYGQFTLRIAVKVEAPAGSFRGHWAVYDGPMDGCSTSLFEQWTERMPAFAPAQREAKAQAIAWAALICNPEVMAPVGPKPKLTDRTSGCYTRSSSVYEGPHG
jgi:hypothetical protein